MNRKLIITKLNGQIWTALFENDQIAELHPTGNYTDAKGEFLGNIYVGKVKNIVANINAAFIEISDGVSCYYSMQENPTPIFTRKIGKKPLCIGDELLVQVSKEAVKTKVPTVTSKLNFTGKYAVLTHGDTRVGVSTKLEHAQRERLLAIATPFATKQYGFILRTNAKDADEATLQKELESLIADYEELISAAATRVCFSCLKKAPKQYLTELRNIYQEGLTDILVENQTLYEEVRDYLANEQPEDLCKLRLYQNELLPLHKLYSIESHIEHALKERVWLKSGAYLVIQPTEALTVIDVNTGKAISKKYEEESALKINLEAAKEAARQIRLRNLSGIILVDFINLSNKSYTEELLTSFRHDLMQDPVSTTLVDVTKLQLVEITRKKIRKPLHEAIQDL